MAASMKVSAPQDPYELFRFNMACAHDTFKAGYDSIQKHLETPPTSDLTNFIGYCEAWACGIDHHHNMEESVVFPFLQTKLDFSREVEQHKGVHAGVDEVLALLQRAKADPTVFDPGMLKEIMKRLKAPLYDHLDEEVEHIKPENLKVFSESEMHKLNNDVTVYARNHADLFTLLPFIRSHTSPEYKDSFPAPPIPWVLRKVLVPYIFAMRFSGYWKYSPYATS
ncbi:hypothetical protein OBBRIDRAFT_798421 [Obba rivulosa]|uniref:Hemerythrin-like domain-containing protein n=1 Tax=Obba rivulosa TaxID=1052685 RepID=A0A8E2DET1_9APHY|nr:hypothetical protein OBBRIDRAFT_798421 [Obba rivulosa]